MKKFTFSLEIYAYIAIGLLFLSFSWAGPAIEEAGYMQQKLTAHYNSEPGGKTVKRYELHITEEGFCRYKRFFTNGKIEYFSCNIRNFKELDYSGTVAAGTLYIRTKTDDVIVQTYNTKRGGDVDSMATFMAIPLKNLEAEDLVDLAAKFQEMNVKLHQ